jgi:hypothetical protein
MGCLILVRGIHPLVSSLVSARELKFWILGYWLDVGCLG